MLSLCGAEFLWAVHIARLGEDGQLVIAAPMNDARKMIFMRHLPIWDSSCLAARLGVSTAIPFAENKHDKLLPRPTHALPVPLRRI